MVGKSVEDLSEGRWLVNSDLSVVACFATRPAR